MIKIADDVLAGPEDRHWFRMEFRLPVTAVSFEPDEIRVLVKMMADWLVTAMPR